MNSRLPQPLRLPIQPGQPSPPGMNALRDAAEQQITARLADVEGYLKQHPTTGIATAFCIGMLLGWLIKRR